MRAETTYPCPGQRSLLDNEHALGVLDTLVDEQPFVEVGSPVNYALRDARLFFHREPNCGALNDETGVESAGPDHDNVVGEVATRLAYVVFDVPAKRVEWSDCRASNQLRLTYFVSQNPPKILIQSPLRPR